MSKYHSVSVWYNGERFDSRKECHRWQELKLLEKAGQIKNLRRQVKYELIPKQDGERSCDYYADFVYDENGQTVVEDCKGVRTDVYRIKRKLMLYRYGVKIRET